MLRSSRLPTAAALLIAALVLTVPSLAQWDPVAGQWGKAEPTDLRIMQYNVHDTIRSIALKSDTDNSWHALVRIVAAMRPDVLFIEEAGDLGTGVDTVENLTATFDMFLHGGTDIFQNPPTPVTAYVQRWAPGYDLPYVYVSVVSDGYNRNVLLSRYPFVDLNGDGQAVLPRIYSNDGDANAPWVPGGNDGIRGFINAEIDLPDDIYAGDLVALCGHLKAGSDSSSQAQRLTAAKNIAYYIDYMYNGAGTGMPDPDNRIEDFPQVTSILDPQTPVIIGGDWNEDELNNGRRGPADWITRANVDGGTDGTDRDRSDMTYDAATEPRLGSRNTFGDSGNSKLDYIAWQDSIATLRNAFILKTAYLISTWFPPEFVTYPNASNPNPGVICARASDHRPLVVDLALPLVPSACAGDINCDGVVDFADIDSFVEALSYPGGAGWPHPDCPWISADVNGDGLVDFADIDPFVARIGASCP